jgi:GntR family carbon starvation induced transcriptional regulator
MADNITLASSCFNQIRQLILTGELLPAERIKGEYLKSRLQVGLSPIREALSRLVTTGLVEIVDNAGFRVASLSQEKISDTFQSLAKLETLLLREAIESGDETWEAQIMACLYRLSKIEANNLKVSHAVWSIRNDEFHEALIAGCQLQALKQMRQNCLLLKEWCYGLAYPALNEELIMVHHQEHAQIAELAVQRKADAACAMLYKHTLHSLTLLSLRLQRVGILAKPSKNR